MNQIFKSEIVKYIKEKDLDPLISKLHSGAFISKGSFSSRIRSTVQDMEWNHLDQSHRLYVHDAYHNALRIATSKDLAVSLMAFKNLPIYIQVADMRVERGLFYQSYTFFGLLFCHQICRMIQDGEYVNLEIEWRTVSHKWLRFVHNSFNKKMYRLIDKQCKEDLPLRQRRAELRDHGVQFKTNEPDFLNSNALSDMVIFPKETSENRFDVLGLKEGVRTQVKLGMIELYLTKTSRGLEVLPGICPHEGATMSTDHICEGAMVCPWHNRKFNPVILNNDSGRMTLGNFEVKLEDHFITVQQKQKTERLDSAVSESRSEGVFLHD